MGVGILECAVILFVVLLLFAPRLPKVGKALRRAKEGYRDALGEDEESGEQ